MRRAPSSTRRAISAPATLVSVAVASVAIAGVAVVRKAKGSIFYQVLFKTLNPTVTLTLTTDINPDPNPHPYP